MSQSRLSPLDAAFLHVEDRSNRMQLAGMLIFDGPAPSYDEFRSAIERKLPHLPHFRQRLLHGVLGLRPEWVDDEMFDLDYHVHRTALPAPGGHAETVELIDHMTAAPLDLQRPLWELALVEGLEDNGFAIAIKVHHCMVDGLSIIDIFTTLCSLNPNEVLPDAVAWTPRSAPSAWDRTLTSLKTAPASTGKAFVSAARAPGSLWESVRLLRRATRLIGMAPETRFNAGESGPTRRTEYLTVDLQTIHDVRRPQGGTVNNVVLAVVTGALRRYLGRHDELVEAIYAFVPVNRRPDDARGTHGNQIGMTYPRLPVGEPDPEARLAGVVAAVAASSSAQQADDTAALIQLGRFAPQPLAAVANRSMQFKSGMFNLTVTNVPGPPSPVYFLGRKLRLILGATPLSRKHALTIAVLSYNGSLTFSVTTDPTRVPDGETLVDDIRDELALLHDLASTPTLRTTR